MIKRDKIQEVLLEYRKDTQGGDAIKKIYKDFIDACVSTATSFADMTEFNLKQEKIIYVITNIELSQQPEMRYCFKNSLYQVRNQTNRGIEYYSTLVETPN